MTLVDLTYKIKGCAMEVYNTLGNGFQDLKLGLWLNSGRKVIFSGITLTTKGSDVSDEAINDAVSDIVNDALIDAVKTIQHDKLHDKLHE